MLVILKISLKLSECFQLLIPWYFVAWQSVAFWGVGGPGVGWKTKQGSCVRCQIWETAHSIIFIFGIMWYLGISQESCPSFLNFEKDKDGQLMLFFLPKWDIFSYKSVVRLPNFQRWYNGVISCTRYIFCAVTFFPKSLEVIKCHIFLNFTLLPEQEFYNL